MEALDSVLSVERLTSVGLAGDSDASIRVEVLHNTRVIAEAPFLLPREHCGVRKVEGHRDLGLYLVDVLPPRPT